MNRTDSRVAAVPGAAVPGAVSAGAAVTEHLVRLGDLDQFWLDAPGASPPLLLLHGLSANAHSFGGLLAAGLAPAFRVVAPDLRGRARSGKPASGYAMADHARDVVRLLDHLGLGRVVVAGHSFGGYLGIWLAANFPERVERLVVIDAAIQSHPKVGEMLKPSLARLTRTAPSADAWLAGLRAEPHLGGFWDDRLEQYFRAEMVEDADGTVRCATSAAAIGQAVLGVGTEPWLHWVQQVRQPALLLNALESFGPPEAGPLMDEVVARATARAFPDGRYAVVPGNHLTMVFGAGAAATRQAIERFVRDGA